MAEGAGLWSKVIGTAQIVLRVRWPLADSQETISPLVTDNFRSLQSASQHSKKQIVKTVRKPEGLARFDPQSAEWKAIWEQQKPG